MSPIKNQPKGFVTIRVARHIRKSIIELQKHIPDASMSDIIGLKLPTSEEIIYSNINGHFYKILDILEANKIFFEFKKPFKDLEIPFEELLTGIQGLIGRLILKENKEEAIKEANKIIEILREGVI